MKDSTRRLLARILFEHDLIFIFGFTQYATYVHADGVRTEEITDDSDFQTVNAFRWVVIEHLEDGSFAINIKFFQIVDSEIFSFVVQDTEDVLSLLEKDEMSLLRRCEL